MHETIIYITSAETLEEFHADGGLSHARGITMGQAQDAERIIVMNANCTEGEILKDRYGDTRPVVVVSEGET